MKKNLIIHIVNLILVFGLIVFFTYSWYTANDTVKANGITGATSNSEHIHFKPEIKAVRHTLSGDIITNTYRIDSTGRIILTESIYYHKKEDVTDDPITEFSPTQYFDMSEILPGEYIDIEIGYYMDDVLDGSGYQIKLYDLIKDTPFDIDGKLHTVAGAFKYKTISLKDEAHKATTTDVSDFTADSNFTWFETYNIAENYDTSSSVTILNHTWNKNYEYLYFTFRIQEDFTQYYRLIGQSENSYGRLLSNLDFNIGKFMIMV